MTTSRSMLGTLVTCMLLLAACGSAEEADKSQTAPPLSGDEPKKIIPGMTEFTITRPTINRMWGSSDKDVWGVGQGAIVVHWDGKAWQRIAVPTGNNLLAVWGSSDKDVWAVGEGGVVMHWTGSRWARVTTPVPDSAALNDVWGSASDDVWAVGENGTIVHWNSFGWSKFDSGTTQTLRSIWATMISMCLSLISTRWLR